MWRELLESLGFTLEGVAEAGDSGATWLARDPSDLAVVLKVARLENADSLRAIGRVTDVLRGRGYPIPRHLDVIETGDAAVQVQERVPGRPGNTVTAALADAVLACIELQAGVQGRPGRLPWGEHLVRSLVEGERGYAEHGSLQAGGRRERRLLDWIRRVGAETSAAVFPHDDAVHYDLHHHNLLQDDQGRLAAVIDWQALEGDRRFDLVAFAHSLTTAAVEPETRWSLWEQVEASVPPDVVRAYVAHMTLRLVDWQLRFHPEMVEPWLDEGERLLQRYP